MEGALIIEALFRVAVNGFFQSLYKNFPTPGAFSSNTILIYSLKPVDYVEKVFILNFSFFLFCFVTFFHAFILSYKHNVNNNERKQMFNSCMRKLLFQMFYYREKALAIIVISFSSLYIRNFFLFLLFLRFIPYFFFHFLLPRKKSCNFILSHFHNFPSNAYLLVFIYC